MCELTGAWNEMGQQYGTFAEDKVQPLWDLSAKPFIDKGWMTEADALATFGTRVYEASSTRRQAFYRGVADGMGWPVDKTVLLDQCGIMGMYQAKLHSFSGCTSLSAWGDATKDGHRHGPQPRLGRAVLRVPALLLGLPPDRRLERRREHQLGRLELGAEHPERQGCLRRHARWHVDGRAGRVGRASSIANTMFDWLLDSASARAIGYRFNSTRTDVPFIWGVADTSGDCFPFETSLYDSRRGSPSGSTLCVCNTYVNPDWGIQKRDTISNSLTRYENLSDRAAEALGELDAAKMMEIFDLGLFNEDGTFKENGGATKPTKQDVDLTNYQIVTDLNESQVWLKIPQAGEGDWRHIDLNAMFAG